MSLIILLSETTFKTNDHILKKLISFLKKNSYNAIDKEVTGSDFNKLGDGTQGTVYASPKYKGLVVRVGVMYSGVSKTDWEKVMDSGDKFTNVVRVYYYKRISERYAVSVMENLDRLPQYIEDCYMHIRYHTEYATSRLIQEMSDKDTFLYRLSESQLKEDIDEVVASFSGEVTKEKMMDELHHFFVDINNGILELASIGIYYNDLHSGNFMYDMKNNKYKIIDFGS
jgi:serine/threonine protein kinase